jgi:hypothetical protein
MATIETYPERLVTLGPPGDELAHRIKQFEFEAALETLRTWREF